MLPRVRRLTDRPLAAYAHINNAMPICGWSYAQAAPPTEYGTYVQQWLEVGAAVVGGCCGTTPAHIEVVRRTVDRLASRLSNGS